MADTTTTIDTDFTAVQLVSIKVKECLSNEFEADTKDFPLVKVGDTVRAPGKYQIEASDTNSYFQNFYIFAQMCGYTLIYSGKGDIPFATIEKYPFCKVKTGRYGNSYYLWTKIADFEAVVRNLYVYLGGISEISGVMPINKIYRDRENKINPLAYVGTEAQSYKHPGNGKQVENIPGGNPENPDEPRYENRLISEVFKFNEVPGFLQGINGKQSIATVSKNYTDSASKNYTNPPSSETDNPFISWGSGPMQLVLPFSGVESGNSYKVTRNNLPKYNSETKELTIPSEEGSIEKKFRIFGDYPVIHIVKLGIESNNFNNSFIPTELGANSAIASNIWRYLPIYNYSKSSLTPTNTYFTLHYLNTVPSFTSVVGFQEPPPMYTLEMTPSMTGEAKNWWLQYPFIPVNKNIFPYSISLKDGEHSIFYLEDNILNLSLPSKIITAGNDTSSGTDIETYHDYDFHYDKYGDSWESRVGVEGGSTCLPIFDPDDWDPRYWSGPHEVLIATPYVMKEGYKFQIGLPQKIRNVPLFHNINLEPYSNLYLKEKCIYAQLSRKERKISLKIKTNIKVNNARPMFETAVPFFKDSSYPTFEDNINYLTWYDTNGKLRESIGAGNCRGTFSITLETENPDYDNQDVYAIVIENGYAIPTT